MTIPAEPTPSYAGWYTTIEEAQQALENAESDTRADHGEEMVEQGWYDIVHAVAALCTAEVAAELLRRQGF